MQKRILDVNQIATDEARYRYQQASREQPVQVLLNAALERAGELAQMGRLQESRRVLEINFLSAIKQDQDEAARTLAIELNSFYMQ